MTVPANDSYLVRHYMPYVYQKIDDQEFPFVFLPLNRQYKPLGVITDKFVDYDDYRTHRVVFKKDPTFFKNIWTNPCYLFNDGPESQKDYFIRLERLLKHPCEPYPTKNLNNDRGK